MTYDEFDYKEVMKHYNIQYDLDGIEQEEKKLPWWRKLSFDIKNKMLQIKHKF
jgi:hypothetical protein